MAGSEEKDWEDRLRETAAGFVYPPTPDVSPAVGRRLAGWRQQRQSPRPTRLLAGAMAAGLLILAIVLAVHPVRAAVFDFLRIGAVDIFVSEKPVSTLSAPEKELFDLAGETTLAQAAGMVDFAMQLPTYPAGLGLPDKVYLQALAEPGFEGQAAISVWLDPDQPEEAQLSLYQIGAPFYGVKNAMQGTVRETNVNGATAFWVEGPHQLQLSSGDYQDWFFVPGSVLIWTDGDMTYRLESGLSLVESVRIAESLERYGGE